MQAFKDASPLRPLFAALKDGHREVVLEASAALCNLVTFGDAVKSECLGPHGLGRMMELVTGADVELRRNALLFLKNLAFDAGSAIKAGILDAAPWVRAGPSAWGKATGASWVVLGHGCKEWRVVAGFVIVSPLPAGHSGRVAAVGRGPAGAGVHVGRAAQHRQLRGGLPGPGRGPGESLDAVLAMQRDLVAAGCWENTREGLMFHAGAAGSALAGAGQALGAAAGGRRRAATWRQRGEGPGACAVLRRQHSRVT